MSENGTEGIVYVLSNPAMPGLVKIGKTARTDIQERLKELYSTGVPVPFECVYACNVPNMDKMEKAFHTAFAPYRLNSKREFFQIAPHQAVALLEMHGENVTTQIQETADTVDAEAKSAKRKLKRRPFWSFAQMGIPLGGVLLAIRDESITAEVMDSGWRVRYEGESMTLSQATTRMLGLKEGAYPSPKDHWTYEGKRLTDIYEEHFNDDEAE